MSLIKDGFAAQLHDLDPEETDEWLASFDAMLDAGGQQRARYLMLRLLARAKEQHIALPALTTTDYINTIPTEAERRGDSAGPKIPVGFTTTSSGPPSAANAHAARSASALDRT